MQTIRDSFGKLIEAADPWFVTSTVGVAIAVGLYASIVASVVQLRYIHLVVGLLWTGCNLLLGLVLGPTLADLDDRAAVNVYGRAAPRLSFLLPMLLILAIGIGLPLAVQMHLFPHAVPWLVLFGFLNLTAVLGVFGWEFDAWRDWRWQTLIGLVALVSIGLFRVTVDQFGMTLRSMFITLVVGSAILVTGLGVILSGNVHAALEARTEAPDHTLIATLGRRNAMLARIQILLQIVIIISVL